MYELPRVSLTDTGELSVDHTHAAIVLPAVLAEPNATGFATPPKTTAEADWIAGSAIAQNNRLRNSPAVQPDQ